MIKSQKNFFAVKPFGPNVKCENATAQRILGILFLFLHKLQQSMNGLRFTVGLFHRFKESHSKTLNDDSRGICRKLSSKAGNFPSDAGKFTPNLNPEPAQLILENINLFWAFSFNRVGTIFVIIIFSLFKNSFRRVERRKCAMYTIQYVGLFNIKLNSSGYN